MPSLVQKLLLLGGSGFTPTQISGLVSWYDASDTSTLWEDSARTTPAADNADVIGAWDDKSGNGYHATQATTINKPTLRTNVQNGKNAIRFDGSDDFLNNASYSDLADEYTIFVVAKYNSAGSADAAQALLDISAAATNTGFMLFHEATGIARFRDVSQSRSVVSAGNYRDGVARIHTARLATTQGQYFINGASVGTVAYTAPNGNTLNNLTIGRLIATASYSGFNDDYEILIYNRDLTAQEKADTEAYLNAKWAVY